MSSIMLSLYNHQKLKNHCVFVTIRMSSSTESTMLHPREGLLAFLVVTRGSPTWLEKEGGVKGVKLVAICNLPTRCHFV